jgi:hypothetical protein
MLIYDPFNRNYGKLQIFVLSNQKHFFGLRLKPELILVSNLQNQENLQAALNYIIRQSLQF